VHQAISTSGVTLTGHNPRPRSCSYMTDNQTVHSATTAAADSPLHLPRHGTVEMNETQEQPCGRIELLPEWM